MEWLWVFLGGGAGSICRYTISKIALQWQTQLPLGTILANIIACLALGMIIGWSMRHPDHKHLQLLLAVGFCGGFSTFSTFSLENVQLWQNGAYAMALLNTLISVIICFVCVFAGLKITGGLALK